MEKVLQITELLGEVIDVLMDAAKASTPIEAEGFMGLARKVNDASGLVIEMKAEIENYSYTAGGNDALGIRSKL